MTRTISGVLLGNNIFCILVLIVRQKKIYNGCSFAALPRGKGTVEKRTKMIGERAFNSLRFPSFAAVSLRNRCVLNNANFLKGEENGAEA